MKERLKSMFKPTKKKIIVLCIIVAAVILVGFGVHSLKTKLAMVASSLQNNSLSEVTRGDVEVSITGSGSVEPYESYTIIPPVNGDILYAPYEVGDYVEKDAVLYSFDTSDLDTGLEKQQNSLKKTELSRQDTLKSQDKLTITAPCDGTLSAVAVKVGDEIDAKAKIADIQNTSQLKVDIPFNETQIKNIKAGQTAVISSSSHMASVNGKVTHVASSPTPQSDGSMLYSVTVEFTNPGSFTKGLAVGAEINGQISPSSGTVEYYDEKTISSEIDGTVTKVYYKTGDYVRKGQTIAVLSNETVDNDLTKSALDYQDAQLSLKEKQKELDDYNVKSPISGTVITKNSKAGDTIDKTNTTVTMMVVADVSKLKFNLDIDELDVSKVSVGQQVKITADAIADTTFMGEISEISMQGTAENGVTTYTAKVIINEPGQLRPSMNVDATIIVESAQNVLRVPTTDIKTAMGKSYVFVQDDSAKTGKKENNTKEKTNEKAQGGQPSGDARQPQAPDGFKTVEITVGIQGDDYTEVLNGLSEGQQIKQQTTSGTNSMMQMMGGAMPEGGGPGDGPSGGGGGGHQGGGNGGGSGPRG